MFESPSRARAASRWSSWLCAAVALFSLAAGLVIVPHYGISIDTPALFYGGERTVYWWNHHRAPEALDLKGPEPKDFHSPYPRIPAGDDPLHYPAFPGIVAAVTAHALLKVTSHFTDWEAREVGLLLLHVLGLYFFGRYAARLLGPGAGAAALVCLAFYPTVIGVALNNPKDWPSALYYAVGLLAAGVALAEDRPLQLLAAGVFFGLSLSAKLNGAFGILTFILWTPLAFALLYWNRRKLTPALTAAWLLTPMVALSVFVALWPWLYSQGLPNFFHNLAEYLSFLTAYGIGARPTWSSYPLRCLLGYTPPFMLALAGVGLLLGWRAGGRPASATSPGGRPAFAAWTLLVAWSAVVFGRMCAPHSNFYDGSRHFLEYIPGIAGLAGLGLSEVWLALRHRVGGQRAAAALAVLTAVDLAVPIVQYHPFEGSYFSPLVGGLGAAQRHNFLFEPPPHDWRVHWIEGDYWYGATPDMIRDLKLVWKRGQSLAICGPWSDQVDAAFQPETPVRFGDVPTADFVLQGYRGPCGERDELPKVRPSLIEVRRGGGLIYRILGPKY